MSCCFFIAMSSGFKIGPVSQCYRSSCPQQIWQLQFTIIILASHKQMADPGQLVWGGDSKIIGTYVSLQGWLLGYELWCLFCIGTNTCVAKLSRFSVIRSIYSGIQSLHDTRNSSSLPIFLSQAFSKHTSVKIACSLNLGSNIPSPLNVYPDFDLNAILAFHTLCEWQSTVDTRAIEVAQKFKCWLRFVDSYFKVHSVDNSNLQQTCQLGE